MPLWLRTFFYQGRRSLGRARAAPRPREAERPRRRRRLVFRRGAGPPVHFLPGRRGGGNRSRHPAVMSRVPDRWAIGALAPSAWRAGAGALPPWARRGRILHNFGGCRGASRITFGALGPYFLLDRPYFLSGLGPLGAHPASLWRLPGRIPHHFGRAREQTFAFCERVGTALRRTCCFWACTRTEQGRCC